MSIDRKYFPATLLAAALGLAGLLWPPVVSGQLIDDKIYSFVLFDQLEYRDSRGTNSLGWELSAWVGGDFTRLWIKGEGAQVTSGAGGDFELQVLYGRLIAPYWDLQVGGRVDVNYGEAANESRVLLVVGLEGLAPYWFEVEPALFLSQDGDISARLTATYEMFVTQRLIAQSRLEINAAIQEVPAFGIGSGLNDLELGVRLRYEIRRELAPYVGFSWLRRFAGAADLALLEGEPQSGVVGVVGVRVWF